ncbi:hypothetical protein KHA80_12290 [Anaerobacillus sp. HL2]|nr:hypothetical protein KHA80_12290 [Anaerobacillus sp. HL2]
MSFKNFQEIEDPLLKNTIGVQLFGTQFEDLEASILPVLGGIKDEYHCEWGCVGSNNRGQIR